MGHHGGLLAGAAGGGGDQPLLDRQQLGGGPAALLQRPLGDHADRPLGQEPVGQLLELGPGGPGQLAAEGGDHVLAGEGGRGRGQPVRAGQPVEHRGHRPLGQPSWSRSRVRPVTCRTRVSGSMPALGRLGPPPSIQGVRGLVLLGLAGGVDGPLDQPRCPLPTVRRQPVHLQVDLVGALGEPPDQLLGHALAAPGCHGCPPPSTRPRASGRAPAGRWPGRWRPRPADAGTGPGRPTPSSVRPAPGRGWRSPDGCAAAGHPPGMSGGRTRPPAAPVRTRAGHRHGRGGPPGARPGRPTASASPA